MTAPKLTAAQREWLVRLTCGPQYVARAPRRVLIKLGLAIAWLNGSTKITPAGRAAVEGKE